jgi:hypothetical protein
VAILQNADSTPLCVRIPARIPEFKCVGTKSYAIAIERKIGIKASSELTDAIRDSQREPRSYVAQSRWCNAGPALALGGVLCEALQEVTLNT